MLRVFKLRSAMSMGAWILVAFSNWVLLALVCFELHLRGFTNPPLIGLLWLAEAVAAVTGLLLAGYTGVLIGATAIPVWSENRTLLPAHFLTSGFGGAAAILELAGFLIPATQILGFAASGIETLIEVLLQVGKRPVDSSSTGRWTAAGVFLIGSLLSRYAWIWAGRASAHDPHAVFQLQHKA